MCGYIVCNKNYMSVKLANMLYIIRLYKVYSEIRQASYNLLTSSGEVRRKFVAEFLPLSRKLIEDFCNICENLGTPLEA